MYALKSHKEFPTSINIKNIAIANVKILPTTRQLNNLIITKCLLPLNNATLSYNLLVLPLMRTNLFWLNIKRILMNVLDTLKLRSVTLANKLFVYQACKYCIHLCATCKGKRQSCRSKTRRNAEMWCELKSKFMRIATTKSHVKLTQAKLTVFRYARAL